MDDTRIKKIRIDRPLLIEQPTDLFYLTGLELSKGRLLIEPSQATLFVDGRYLEQARKKAPCRVDHWDRFQQVQVQEIAFDSAFVTYEGVLSLQKQMPRVHWIAKPKPIRDLRAIKEEKEIAALQKAAHLTWQGYKHAMGLLKEGITEAEVALEFEFYCRKHGASALSFSPTVAFGENSAYPHYRAGQTKLKKGDVVLMDVGAVVDHYAGDMTRIAYFGERDPQIVHFEKLVAEAKQKAIQAIRPGVRFGLLDQIVQDTFAAANVKQLYIHALGHGVGLEVHEFPRIRFDGEDRDVLIQAGMVITIEPGLYQPGVGGVRLEDTLVVTETGVVNFFDGR